MSALRAAGLSLALWATLGIAGTPAPATPPGHAVATAHPLATAAALEVLAGGGNAFDAAVAVSAALAVVEPYSSGIGGGGFWLLHRASDGFETMVDGRETAPLAASPDMYLDARGVAQPRASLDGPRAAGIPGSPAAWAHVARRYGALPLARSLAPALRLARDGYAVDAKLAEAVAGSVSRLSPAARDIWLPGGSPVAVGATLRQPDLAAVLERLSREGTAGFYSGPVAEQLVAGVRAAGGLWSAEDLARYRAIEREPLRTVFRDYRITTAPPPSAGGVAMAQALAMLEARGWPPADSVQARHQLIEVMRRVFRDRRLLGDPAFVAMPLLRLLSREYLLAQAEGIQVDAATPSEALPAAGEGGHTTHFSIIDAAGNRVAGTLTVNTRFGSGFVVPGTGVLLNNEMDDFAASTTASNAYGLVGSAANRVAPGKRPLSSMTPTFVEGPRGVLVLGTPGGSRIVTMVLRGVLGFIHGMDAAEVVALPRYHHQYLPDQVEYEPGALSAGDQAALNALGHRLKLVPGGFGNMQAVWWDVANDGLQAAADPRGIGTGEVVRLRPERAAAN